MQDPTGMFDSSDVPDAMTMPLILCQSNGGPFDDVAFMSGFDCGALHYDLKVCKFLGSLPSPRILKRVLLKQLDLMCMLYDFVPSAYEFKEDSELCWVIFNKATTVEDLPQSAA